MNNGAAVLDTDSAFQRPHPENRTGFQVVRSRSAYHGGHQVERGQREDRQEP